MFGFFFSFFVFFAFFGKGGGEGFLASSIFRFDFFIHIFKNGKHVRWNNFSRFFGTITILKVRHRIGNLKTNQLVEF